MSTARSFPSRCRPEWPRIGWTCCNERLSEPLKIPILSPKLKQSQLDIGPVDGPTIAKTLSGLYDLKPATVARLKDILLPKKN